MEQDRVSPFTIVQEHRAAAVEVLRRRIAALEGRQATLEHAGEMARDDWGLGRWGLGLAGADALLPAGGLAGDAIHEIAAADYGDRGAMLGFALALLRRRGVRGSLLWCCQRRQVDEAGFPYGPGLLAAGIAPENLIVMMAPRQMDVLWAVEEGLRTGALGAVLAEVGSLDFTASRRLALAAQAGRTPALLLGNSPFEGATAAESRWRVAAAPSLPDLWDARAPGRPCWQVSLMKCRGGQVGGHKSAWILEWDDETGDFRLAAAMADRPVAWQKTGSSAG